MARQRSVASSGDPVLDRRYGWAEAALKDGDAQAAVEILDQTLSQAYHFTAAWHLYGLAQEALGHKEDAATAWRQCLDLGIRVDCEVGLNLDTRADGIDTQSSTPFRRTVLQSPPGKHST